jgi:TRAP-type uncharacterized transport system fused permease subunit
MLALAGYIIPFMFIYNPPLLFDGSWAQILWAALTAILGVTLLAVGIQGWWQIPLNIFGRLIMLASALCMITTGLWTDLAGFTLLGFFLFFKNQFAAGEFARA